MSAFLHVCKCTMCVLGVKGYLKKTWNPLELGLHIVGSHPMGAVKQTQLLCKQWVFLTTGPTLQFLTYLTSK